MSDLLALGSLSVVIPVRDDPLLFRCLASVDEKVEVVVVTNGSSPDYRQSVVEVTDPPITVVSLAEAGIGGAYNAGITAASGKYIQLPSRRRTSPKAAWCSARIIGRLA